MAGRSGGSQSAAQVAQNWANGYAGSGNKIAARMNAGDFPDPTAAAVAQQNTMTSNWNAAVSSGRWASALQRAGKQGYIQGMLQKTVPSVGTRAQAGMQHFQAFWQQWQPFLAQATAGLPPRGTYEQNKQRAAAMMDAEHAQRGNFRHLWNRG